MLTKQQARSRVAIAVASGELIRRACEVCASPNGEGHHGDYQRPLDVRWLCQPCHADWHRAHGVLPGDESHKWRRDLLLDESLREHIERLARVENRSVNNMLETLIRRALGVEPPELGE